MTNRDPAPITDLAAYRASKQPAPKPRPLVGVREVNGALELYFKQGKVRVDVPVSLETAVGYAGDILQLVREIRGTMNARSLVGMTMGARKRAVLREMNREDSPQHGERLDYWEVRARYRIGERLRPCPKCRACHGGWSYGDNLLRSIWDRGDLCSGSGVLPAKGGGR